MSLSSKKDLTAKIMRDKIYSLLLQDKRIDGRDPKSLRPVTIQTNLITKADGSALVAMGGTKILTGIKVEIGSPFPDRPDEGIFTVNAELLPLASTSFEPGPPDERGVELARVVDRSLREGGALDLKKLCLIEGEKVYAIFIDIYVLDYDGNYFDPALISALAALATTKIPRYEVVDGEIRKTDEFSTLEFAALPFTTMIGIIGEKFLVDPQIDEEKALDVSLIIGTDEKGNVISIQKNSPGPIPVNLLDTLLDVAIEKTDEIRKKFLQEVPAKLASERGGGVESRI
ncbi:MAG: exosome complex protein Rrp42 [Nitrososphaeria archaeon]|nr:exosome complex protein Rrp42 [Aigarchaeota archaeon]MCX8187093.1 exosome complex protein Rrp42 [Nitrososphaeria archaeon]MDW8021369.1 exosome complex protein Rrp42 [Nitrososphaerota archaeon]